MITKEITIAGKKIMLAYCYATEIGYKNMTGEDIITFVKDAVVCIEQKIMPDIKKTVCFIVASHISYCQGKDVDVEMKDEDLMFNATPTEIGFALGTIMTMRAQFYEVPEGEQPDKTDSNGKEALKNG